MASPNRQGGGGLSMQTLVIASAASMCAALVTSRLFPPGALFTAAITPVIVAMVSEFLHRPVNRVTELREARRSMVRQAEPIRAARTGRELPPDVGPWADPPPDLIEPAAHSNGTGAPPVRIHGRRRFGRIHPRVAVVTGLVAFAIGAAALTLPELIFGGAAVSGKRTTLVPVGGSDKKSEPKRQEQQAAPAETQTGTQTAPSQEAPQTTTETAPAPSTETAPAPSGGAPAPAPQTAPAQPSPSQTAPGG